MSRLILTAAALALASVAPVDALTFNFIYVDNVEGDFASRGWLDSNSSFQRNITAAAEIWGAIIESDATIDFQIEADRNVARTGGTFSNGRFLGFDEQGNQIFEPGPLSRILTGSNPGGPPDMFIRVNAAFVESNYWFDPTPTDRLDMTPPLGLTDFVSIVLHEMGHGFGIAGTRQFAAGPGYGTLPGFANPFDDLSYFGGNGNPLAPSGNPNPMFFEGATAAGVFGSDAPLSHVGPAHPLSSQDFYHLGTCGDPAILTLSLMNGCSVPTDGTLMRITPIDRALLVDVGYPITMPSATEVAATHRAAKNPDDVSTDVRWDVDVCQSRDYNLFFGPLSGVSSLTYTGASCGLGLLGRATVSLPDQNLFWIIAGVGLDDIEGPHGRSSSGAVRSTSGVGLCNVLAQDPDAVCP